jgi:hypothetical protein
MDADNHRLQEWLKQDGNYGIGTGFGLAVLDADHPQIRDILESRFPPSLTVETPGHRGLQYYFFTGPMPKLFLRTDTREHAGEILTEGFMAVGPGSIHPNGQSYEIVKDAPFAALSKDQLAELLGDHLVPEKQISRTEKAAAKERRHSHDLDILKVIPLAELKVLGDEYYGPHPVHGSDTGHNFWVNSRKNCWYCFRHGSGGGPLLWIGVQEGIISCEEAGPGALRGDGFRNVRRKAVELGYIPALQDIETADEKRGGHARKLVKLFLEKHPLLFHDEREVPYARLESSPSEILRLRSVKARTLLASLLWDSEGKVPGSEALTSALNVVHHLALKGPMFLLHNRVAWHQDAVWLDLVDEGWRAVRIAKEGWTIEPEPPTLFRRYLTQLRLAEPLQGGNPWRLLDYVNIQEKDQLLLMVYVGTLLIPEIPHPVLTLHGPQGSAKTTLMTILKDLLDPSAVGVGTLPRDERELVQALDHSYLNFFDNVSSLKDWISDALCRATTGMGFAKRQLYTDDEDVIYRLQRPIGMNGINVTAQRPDLLDRSLLIGLEQIPDDKRRQLSELQAKFRQDQPLILGGLLDTIVKALNIAEPKLDRTRRMADFLSWGYRIAEALGRSAEEFIQAYDENIQEAAEEAVRADILAEALLEFLEATQDHRWEGTATALLSELRLKADELHVSTRQKGWPKSSSALTRRLRLLKDPLRKIGYSVEFTRGQKRLISIAFEAGRISKTPSKPSTPSRQGQSLDDIDDIDDTSETFPALGALRMIKGPFTEDYAVGRIMRTIHVSREEAEAWVKRMIDEGLLAKDPEGYLRLVK